MSTKEKKSTDTTVAKPKVTRKTKAVAKVKKMPSSKVIANNNWKQEVFSLSALKRYCNGKGKADVLKVLNEQNEKHGVKLNLSYVLNMNNIKRVSTVKDFNRKNPETGEFDIPKTKFSLWLIVGLGIGRLAREAKANQKAVKKAA